MVQMKSQLLGSEALLTLESSAGAELKRARQVVEEAAAADLTAYFQGAGFGKPAANLCSSLVSAALAGGQWGFNNLVTRLSASSVGESEYEKVANDLLELIAPFAKILNYARFRAGSVQSYVTQSEIPSMKLQVMLLSKSDLAKYERDVLAIKNSKLKDHGSLESWVDLVDDLCEYLSESQLEQDDSNEKRASKSKKGTVSTKSISSYSKHWKSYASEILAPRLGLNWDGDYTETISCRLENLEDYKPRTWIQIQADLTESVSTRRSFSSSKKKPKKENLGAKLITEEKDLGGRILTLTFNSSGLDEDLIQPALNSIKGQLIRNQKQEKISVNMKTENSSISIEIEKPTKEDLDTIEILLNSHR
jgi:hypothetical protein